MFRMCFYISMTEIFYWPKNYRETFVWPCAVSAFIFLQFKFVLLFFFFYPPLKQIRYKENHDEFWRKYYYSDNRVQGHIFVYTTVIIMYRYRSSISRSIQNFGFFFFPPKFTTIHRAYRNIVYPTQQYNTITTRTPARRARVSCHRSFDIKILYYYFYINLEEKKKRNKSRLNYIYYCCFVLYSGGRTYKQTSL